MIDEEQISALRAKPYPEPFTGVLNTCEALWKVARAARRWTKAAQGTPSVDAEALLVEALDALFTQEPAA